MDHVYFLSKLAEKAYSKPNTNRVRIMAGIVWHGDFIAIDSNSDKSHPFHKRFIGYKEDQNYPHAETNVIRKSLDILSPKELSKAKLYVARVKLGEGNTKFHPGHYEWAMAMPCTGCQGAIASFKISEVYFTQSGDFQYGRM